MTTFASGTLLGPYEILSRLGSRGMGEVWKGRDTRLDRLVAIKRVTISDDERFAIEARAIAALNHPNICQLRPHNGRNEPSSSGIRTYRSCSHRSSGCSFSPQWHGRVSSHDCARVRARSLLHFVAAIAGARFSDC